MMQIYGSYFSNLVVAVINVSYNTNLQNLHENK
jgi:hypothetical protein